MAIFKRFFHPLPVIRTSWKFVNSLSETMQSNLLNVGESRWLGRWGGTMWIMIWIFKKNSEYGYKMKSISE